MPLGVHETTGIFARPIKGRTLLHGHPCGLAKRKTSTIDLNQQGWLVKLDFNPGDVLNRQNGSVASGWLSRAEELPADKTYFLSFFCGEHR